MVFKMLRRGTAASFVKLKVFATSEIGEVAEVGARQFAYTMYNVYSSSDKQAQAGTQLMFNLTRLAASSSLLLQFELLSLARAHSRECVCVGEKQADRHVSAFFSRGSLEPVPGFWHHASPTHPRLETQIRIDNFLYPILALDHTAAHTIRVCVDMVCEHSRSISNIIESAIP